MSLINVTTIIMIFAAKFNAFIQLSHHRIDLETVARRVIYIALEKERLSLEYLIYFGFAFYATRL